MEPKGEKRCASALHDLESNSWQISDGVSGTSESSDKHLVVIVNKTHSSISWDEGGDLFTVLLELNSDTFTDSRVWLLGLDSDLLDDDTGSMGCSSEWLLPFSSLMSFLVTLIGPSTVKERVSDAAQVRPHLASTYLLRRLLTLSLRPALIPLGFPLPIVQI